MSAPLVWRAVLRMSLWMSLSWASLFWTSTLAAQGSAQATTTCNLDDGRQVYVRYTPTTTKNEKVANGKPLTPGGTPMTLFTEAQLSLGSGVVPLGAFSVYPIPAKGNWTLAVNKNVTPGAAYDEKQDVVRAPMETVQVADSTEALEVAFAHVGARCTLRIYIGKSASFVDFTAK